jgi:hypothetical protein
MNWPEGYTCRTCGQYHDAMPFSWRQIFLIRMRIFRETSGTLVPSLVRINALWTLNGFSLEEWLKFRSLEARSHSCGEYELPFENKFMKKSQTVGN